MGCKLHRMQLIRPIAPYRSGVTIYQLNSDTPVATSITSANPKIGAGGLSQVFIPNYRNVLTPLYSFPY